MHDDGLAIRALAILEAEYEFPENVSLLDRACLEMAILSDIRKHKQIILLDAIDKSGHPPGTVLRFSPDELSRYSQIRCAHDMRISDVLDAATLLDYEIDCRCFGVQVASLKFVDPDTPLSPEVETALPLLIEAVLAELKSLGVEGVKPKVH
jgi:hydrogenase maturation protease